ncbi:MAG: hypothetical protein IKJ93_05710 [Clostridia bacterium]|nr:hypothetical protein [Clostridia bacterium]
MDEKIINSMDDERISPFDLITLMFERTDEDGVLYVPSFSEKCEDYRCHVDWNLSKYESLMDKFTKHFDAIKQIGALENKLDGTYDTSKKVLGKELADFWNIYIRPFDIGDIDFEKVLDITDRLETIEWVRSIAENFAKGKELDEKERQILTDYIDIAVTPEEKKYRRNHVETVYSDAEKRLGKKLCAYDFILYSMRLCRLINLKAPEIIIRNEACALATSMLLYEYGISRECVDSTRRLQLEKMELMSEEELDELYRPQKANTRKSLAPLFVFEILSKYSNSKTHLRQNDILKKLSEYPYEISLERKALSRIIHNLTDSTQYAVFQDKSGVWVEQEKKG